MFSMHPGTLGTMTGKGLRVVFVCTGNTCRSPMAARVLIALLATTGQDENFDVSSRGTDPTREGAGMDPRARRALTARGIDPGEHRVQKLRRADLAESDLFVALSREHAVRLTELGADDAHVVLLGAFDPEQTGVDVPDPFEADQTAYEEVLTQIEQCLPALSSELTRRAG